MKFAYADPPYPGNAHLYKDHPDYAGEVDHKELIARMDSEYDGWLLHTGSNNLAYIMGLLTELDISNYRVMSWVKPFAAFKRNVSVAYAWEPIIVKAIRKPVVSKRIDGLIMRDWLAESITLKKGLTGTKPSKVCVWLFEVSGLEPEDEFYDLYPGTLAVSEAHEDWCDTVEAWRRGDLR